MSRGRRESRNLFRDISIPPLSRYGNWDGLNQYDNRERDMHHDLSRMIRSGMLYFIGKSHIFTFILTNHNYEPYEKILHIRIKYARHRMRQRN